MWYTVWHIQTDYQLEKHRYRRSLKRIREKRQEKGIPQEPVGDEGRGDGVKTLPPRRQEEEEEEEEEGEPVVAADGGDSGLDDTTARITSLLQRIEGDTLQETQADGELLLEFH